jgi:2-phosphoglycolate phosphatase
MVGMGARGMLRAAFDTVPGDADFERLRDEFLSTYSARMLKETKVFDAMRPVLLALDAHAVPWGIVTNKAERFTQSIVSGLEGLRHVQVVISGDTTPHSKPHPAPLLEAARRLVHRPADCVYVGDDLRDVQAGRAAGMRTIAAGWGYLGEGEPVEAWGADALIEHPRQLLKLLALD